MGSLLLVSGRDWRSRTVALNRPRNARRATRFRLRQWANANSPQAAAPSLDGSTTWVEFDGTSVTRQGLGGPGPTGGVRTRWRYCGHIEGLTLRLYDPQSHQWSLYWANSKGGIIRPPQIGEFKNGRGEFYAQDMLNGRVVLIRFIWTPIVEYAALRTIILG